MSTLSEFSAGNASDEEGDIVHHRTSGTKKKKKNLKKPASRGGSRKSVKHDNIERPISSRQSEASGQSDSDIDKVASEDHDDGHELVSKPQKRTRKKTVKDKPSTPSGRQQKAMLVSKRTPSSKDVVTTTPSPRAASAPMEDKQELTETATENSVITTDEVRREVDDVKMSKQLEIEVSESEHSVVQEVVSGEDDDSEHAAVSDGSEEESEEERREILIKPFSERRIKKVLDELKADPSNLSAAINFCAVLERSSRMTLQDSLNDLKDPNIAHEQTCLASVKLARDLFLEAKKCDSVEKLKKAQVDTSSVDQKIIAPRRPSSAGSPRIVSNKLLDGSSASILKDVHTSEANEEATSEVTFAVGPHGSRDEAEFSQTTDAEQEKISALQKEIDSLRNEVKGMRRSSLTNRSIPGAQKKKNPVILRNRRSSEVPKGTGKLFRTFYRAKSTVSVEEDEQFLDEVLEEDEDIEDNMEERVESILDMDVDSELDDLDYEILDNCLEDICFPRGITVGANEIVLPAEKLDISVEEDIESTFKVLMDGRFGASDLVALSMLERKIISVEYLIAKTKLELESVQNSSIADIEVIRVRMGM